MISYHNFKLFLDKSLLDPLFILPQYYVPHYSTDIKNFYHNGGQGSPRSYDITGNCIYWYEEPLNLKDLTDLSNGNRHLYYGTPENRDWINNEIPGHGPVLFDCCIKLFANSEKSNLKKQWLKENPPFLDWYFFFHGFAALDWYRDFNYIQNTRDYKVSNVFICLNHYVNDNRSYRMMLLSLLQEQKLMQHGLISAPLLTQSNIRNEVANTYSRLSTFGKKHIMRNLWPVANPIIIDDVNYNSASAFIPDYWYKALWNIVTETNFYDEKLHLTEKIFKPIVTKRPFILISSPGNLEYLKSYGFQTFDKWIDESYDQESDPDLRLKMIVDEIKKLCKLSKSELDKMYSEMNTILEYNYNHFYTEFKKIIVNELVDNFESCIKIYNLSLSERFRIPVELVDFDGVKKVLLK
jgi:hypothetical protein